MRRELLDALTALADRDYQRRVWERREDPGVGRYYGWDMAVHALFDDAPLEQGSSSVVGTLLRDEDEARAVDRVVAALNDVFAETGVEAPVEKVLRSAGWPRVVETAALAAKLLRRWV